MFWFVISRNGLLVAGERAVETWPIFVFRVTFYVHRGSGQARVYPRRWSSLSSRAKAFTLQGRHRRFVGDSAFHTSLRGAPLLVGEQRSGITRFCKKYRIWCHITAYHRVLYTSTYTVVQQYALVDYYCCFHLTSGTSTAVCVFTAVCVCVFFPFILDIKFVGRTSWGHTEGRSQRIFHPPSFCGACLNFSREKDSTISFPRRPWSRIHIGPSIVHRNRKRFILSQSTLREEFVEKKYQVFDIIGLLTILVQVNLSSPVERV